MRLATIEPGSATRIGGARISDRVAAAVLADGRFLDLRAAAAALGEHQLAPCLDSVKSILRFDRIDAVRRLVDAVEGNRDGARDDLVEAGAVVDDGTATLCPPIPDPALILCQGLAYRAHLEEMNTAPPKEPTAFIKAASSLVGSGRPVRLPKAFPDMVDFEGEFSIVIGKPCHAVAADAAMNYVAGYTIVNDVSARDWVAPVFDPGQTPIEAAMAWGVNVQGKQLPTFTPMGPAMVTKDEIPDPHDVRLVTRLNGKVMQDARTAELIFPIPELIAHFAQWYRFLPGDVITTGSPAGVGYGREPKVFMRDGDVIEVAVEPIGTLSNPVEAEA